MTGDLPGWARRIRAMRESRGWSQTAAAGRMREHTDEELPATEHLARRWKDWELGRSRPSGFYTPIVAATLGTVTAALFPSEHDARGTPELVGSTGMDTLEIVNRLQASDVNDATLEAVRITADKLCSDYSRRPAADIIVEGRQWLRRVVELQEQRLTFRQRRETLEVAGWLTLLVGCLEYDMGDRRRAEATRRSALSLGKELGSAGIVGWAHEMRAWFALTVGDYRGALDAGELGEAAAGEHSVAVQVIAQQAKAYARMGLLREMERTLERGRKTLDGMSYPDNVENHFVVDPSKYDFYAIDCYRHTGDNGRARELSDEVVRTSTGFGNHERWPMRLAEARITRGVVAARAGDLDEALACGWSAIAGERQSLPSLSMVAQDLGGVLAERYAREPEADAYLERLRWLQRPV